MTSNICVPCGVGMRVKKNDVLAVLMDNERCDVVNAADLWQCPCCKREILSGFSIKRLAIGHEACESFLANKPREMIYRYYHQRRHTP